MSPQFRKVHLPSLLPINQPISTTTLVLSKVKKGKVFYGQEPISGESTTTECGVNYQLLAVMY